MSFGQRRLHLLDPLLQRVGGRHGVLAGLFGHHHGHRGLAIQPRSRGGFFLRVLRVADVAQLHHVRSARSNCDFVELRRIHQPSQRAHGQLARSRVHVAGRHFHVLLPQRVGDVGDGQVVGAHLIRIHPHANFALQPAHQLDLSDAADVFQLRLDLLVGNFGDLAQRARRRQGNLHDRRGVGIELLHHRRLGRVRQIVDDQVYLVADLLRAHIAVLIEFEAG